MLFKLTNFWQYSVGNKNDLKVVFTKKIMYVCGHLIKNSDLYDSSSQDAISFR